MVGIMFSHQVDSLSGGQSKRDLEFSPTRAGTGLLCSQMHPVTSARHTAGMQMLCSCIDQMQISLILTIT